jgi:hypothetical protein
MKKVGEQPGFPEHGLHKNEDCDKKSLARYLDTLCIVSGQEE